MPDATPHARALAVAAEVATAKCRVTTARLERSNDTSVRSPDDLRDRHVPREHSAPRSLDDRYVHETVLAAADRQHLDALAFAHAHRCRRSELAAQLGRVRLQVVASRQLQVLARHAREIEADNDDAVMAREMGALAGRRVREIEADNDDEAMARQMGALEVGRANARGAVPAGGRGREHEAAPSTSQPETSPPTPAGPPTSASLTAHHEACVRLARQLLEQAKAFPDLHVRGTLTDELAEAVRAVQDHGLSRDEMLSVFRALGFGRSQAGFGGHYYTCPNGHLYIISECGGAMETARCNECGAPIGGGSHALLASNRRADLTQFPELHE